LGTDSDDVVVHGLQNVEFVGEVREGTLGTGEFPGSHEALLDVGRASADSAASALSEVLMEEVTIDVSEVHVIPSDRIQEMYENTDHQVIVSLMELKGDASCDILLAFEESEAREIAAVMAMEDSPDDMDPEMMDAALTELGNIVMGCFISTLADSVGVGMLPAPPELFTGHFEAILNRFIQKQTRDADFSVIFKTSFKRGSQTVNGALIAFESKELIQTLTKA
jgi:chemotaxis protein CheC